VLFIFDLDGTLLDTSKGIINSYKWVIHMYNLKEYSDDELMSFIGLNLFSVFKLNFGLNDTQAKEVVAEYRNYYKKQGYKETKVYKEIPNLLTNLKKNNHKLAVATLKSEPLAILILEYFGLKFDFIVGMDKSESLTKGQIIKICLDKFKNNNAVMVGDNQNDAIGAEENNIPFIKVCPRRD
jgi:phosphoglycolate phosphatase